MKYFITLLTITVLISCDSKRVYEQNVELENKLWHKDSVYAFEFNIEETDKDYRLLFNIRNTLEYDYYNLFVQYQLEGGALRSDEKMEEFYLFDKTTGNPFGSGIGDIYDHRMPFIDSIRFGETGTYNVSFRHYMRADSLSEILSIGVRLEEL